jgi:surfactin synthase thioesterase subunit
MRPTSHPTVLVCLPFAGAGASFFRPWTTAAPDGIEIVAPQLPGRERRIAEQPYRDVHEAVRGLLPQVRDGVGDRSRVALFGHSLGAVLAYELAILLAREAADAGVEVVRLVVSGSPGPFAQRTRRATGLPDDEFLLRVAGFAGYRHDALADPQMRELIVPTLRADVEMHEGYRPSTTGELAVPITAVRGRSDALVTTAEVEEWGKATSRAFAVVEVDGGHMYLAERPDDLLRQVAAHLVPD